MYLTITMLLFFILPETWRVIAALPEMRLLQLLFKHVLPYIYIYIYIYTEMKWSMYYVNYHIIRYCPYSEMHINVKTHPLYIVARSTYIKIPMHTYIICRNVHLSKKPTTIVSSTWFIDSSPESSLRLVSYLPIPGPVFTKLFRIRIKIRLKLNIILLWNFFKTCFTYLTIDCW